MTDREKKKGLIFDTVILDDPLAGSTYCLARKAVETIAKNEECMVAKWIIDNPDRDITDICLVQEPTTNGIGYRFYIEEKVNDK